MTISLWLFPYDSKNVKKSRNPVKIVIIIVEILKKIEEKIKKSMFFCGFFLAKIGKLCYTVSDILKKECKP